MRIFKVIPNIHKQILLQSLEVKDTKVEHAKEKNGFCIKR